MNIVSGEEGINEEAMLHEQRLRAAIHYSTGKICREAAVNKGLAVDPKYISTLSEVVFDRNFLELQCGPLLTRGSGGGHPKDKGPAKPSSVSSGTKLERARSIETLPSAVKRSSEVGPPEGDLITNEGHWRIPGPSTSSALHPDLIVLEDD
ncbi:unnamed protein product [Cyprideis torosa]|uniref:Centromere protein S n=1 Tax=Cyprideis torosa TaxID=163714 RepID=A0A7R8W3U4_9CRUS|nr:unnamed protein product [Cyprideis torosa]CAG0883418.1 unnamed protein product [Cyprideis torosa]